MAGVTRVALSSSAKAGQTASPSSGTATGPKRGCPANAPTFDLIVFYRAIAGAGAQGATALGTSTPTTPNGGTK
jgi:hypothetical protein